MGPTPSAPYGGGPVHPYLNDMYVMIQDGDDNEGAPRPSVQKTAQFNQKILKGPFAGIWSVFTPNCVCPIPRAGHFTVHDQENNLMYVGYGLDQEDNPLNDLWVFNLNDYKWREIHLSGQRVSPRVGARAILSGKFLIVFGGYANKQYFADLHSINVETGECRIIETNGEVPPPRSTPIVTMHDGKFFIWGGYNGAYISTLHILHVDSRTWEHIPQDIQGRTAIPGCLVGDKFYSYGSSKQNGIIRIDLTNNKVELIETTGAEPPSTVMGAGMVKVENLLFFFGGKSSSSWTLVYAFDVTKNWWFVFHVMPDGDSVSVADGTVSELGLFMVPRINAFSLVYNERKRELVATLGDPMSNPPHLFIVAIGDALGVIHQRDDMLEAMRNTNPFTNFH